MQELLSAGKRVTGRMSLDVSEILIKFGNLSRLFELSACAILDSVSVVASSLAECAFLRLFQGFSQGVGPRGAKVTNTETLSLSVGCLSISKFPQASLGVWETCLGHLFHLGEIF